MKRNLSLIISLMGLMYFITCSLAPKGSLAFAGETQEEEVAAVKSTTQLTKELLRPPSYDGEDGARGYKNLLSGVKESNSVNVMVSGDISSDRSASQDSIYRNYEDKRNGEGPAEGKAKKGATPMLNLQFNF